MFNWVHVIKMHVESGEFFCEKCVWERHIKLLYPRFTFFVRILYFSVLIKSI